ncbi:hypothetical protein DQ04_00621210 [Trypanosoma grayi]|uniref:hypothetical protein n=1 Tax=Trypanosoma grayi TaxID=71804 RepID=UPI0004F49225|nr:hypothetical protein DQ04_00621210 [Trypanosoma grayi]KEG14112.1 hypothetical protein DQ04_00621210 [Trypanosoma grayi]
MLASLFYNHIASERVEDAQKNENCSRGDRSPRLNNKGDTDVFNEQPHSTIGSFPPKHADLTEQRQLNYVQKFVSSADVFRMYHGIVASNVDEGLREQEMWSRNASLEKIGALALGWLIRKRRRSRLGNELASRIIQYSNQNDGEFDVGVSEEFFQAQRARCVSQFIEFLEHGIAPSRVKEEINKQDISSLQVQGRSRRMIEKRSDFREVSHGIHIGLYSSEKAQRTGEFVVDALREAVGMKECSQSVLLENVTPKFLAERRSVFLQTIFQVEDYEGCLTHIPRIVTGCSPNAVDVNSSLSSIFGGGYYRLVDHVDRICAELL